MRVRNPDDRAASGANAAPLRALDRKLMRSSSISNASGIAALDPYSREPAHAVDRFIETALAERGRQPLPKSEEALAELGEVIHSHADCAVGGRLGTRPAPIDGKNRRAEYDSAGNEAADKRRPAGNGAVAREQGRDFGAVNWQRTQRPPQPAAPVTSAESVTETRRRTRPIFGIASRLPAAVPGGT